MHLGGKRIILCFLRQLEESNNTLTKAVENLSKEKTDLSEKFSSLEEGTVPFVELNASFNAAL